MKTITEKLNLTKYPKKVILNKPESSYLAELTDAKTSLPTEPVDLIFAFVETIEQFQQLVANVLENNGLAPEGLLYIAYPKKGNKKYATYVHRDEIFPTLKVGEDGFIEGTTFKFNRMVSLDEIFTVVGIKNSNKPTKVTKESARVGDYLQFLPEIEKILAEHPVASDFFNQLTPGYKKDWARYVYSGKQAATQEKRKAEMIAILSEGYKSKDLYRQGKK